MSLSFLDPLFEAVAWVIIQIHAGLSLIFAVLLVLNPQHAPQPFVYFQF